MEKMNEGRKVFATGTLGRGKILEVSALAENVWFSFKQFVTYLFQAKENFRYLMFFKIALLRRVVTLIKMG